MPEHWYVAVTLPRAERIAKRQLDEAGIETFLPLCERPPTPNKPLVVEPLWPGYLFVGSAYLPVDARMAQRIITDDDGAPEPLPSGALDRWLNLADKDGIVGLVRYNQVEGYELGEGLRYCPPKRHTYGKGDVVTILNGIGTGHFATVQKAKGQWLRVRAHCFNREVDVDLRAEQVALAFAGATGASEPSPIPDRPIADQMVAIAAAP